MHVWFFVKSYYIYVLNYFNMKYIFLYRYNHKFILFIAFLFCHYISVVFYNTIVIKFWWKLIFILEFLRLCIFPKDSNFKNDFHSVKAWNELKIYEFLYFFTIRFNCLLNKKKLRGCTVFNNANIVIAWVWHFI